MKEGYGIYAKETGPGYSERLNVIHFLRIQPKLIPESSAIIWLPTFQ